jgi:hypothetical protein
MATDKTQGEMMVETLNNFMKTMVEMLPEGKEKERATEALKFRNMTQEWEDVDEYVDRFIDKKFHEFYADWVMIRNKMNAFDPRNGNEKDCEYLPAKKINDEMQAYTQQKATAGTLTNAEFYFAAEMTDEIRFWFCRKDKINKGIAVDILGVDKPVYNPETDKITTEFAE